MKMLRELSFLAAAVLSITLISSCNNTIDQDDLNAQILLEMGEMNRAISIDGDIQFMILTPGGLTEVGYKSFKMSCEEDPTYPELNGTSFFAVTTAGRNANEIASIMGHSQNLSKSLPGDKLNLIRVICGNMLSNNSDIAFASYEGGDIYVKSISDTSITLRFVKVKITNALGDFYFNGDLSFDIE